MKLAARYTPFSIELAGIRWSGFWCVVTGELQVGSAYGSANRMLGRRKPELLARELLIEILNAKLVECEARALESKRPRARRGLDQGS